MTSTAGSGRTPEELRDLLAAYALDAVDDVERRAVERYVAQDEDAARELAGFRATAAALGAAAGSRPPAALRAAVLDVVATTPQDVAPAATGSGRPEARGRHEARRGSRRRAVLALAVAAAVVGAVPTVVAMQQRERAVHAEQEAQLLAELLADPGVQVVRSQVTGGGEAVAVLGDGSAVLVARGLPELDEDRVYQLWALRDGVPLPSGFLPAAHDGAATAVASEYRAGDGLAVSVEPVGGSEAPSTDPVVVLPSS